MTAPGASGARNGRSALWVVLVIGAIVAVGALSVSNRSAVPFDPDSTAPTGTRALVELVGSFGADVDVPDRFSTDDADVAIIFQDATGPDEDAALLEWVRGGATLVVADPFSALAPAADLSSDSTGPVDRDRCTVDSLADIDRLDPTVPKAPSTAAVPTYAVGPDDFSCFGDGTDAFVVVTPVGAGHVVALGSGSLFMNGAIANADNAALATSLLAPRPGTRVAIVEPGAFGEGSPVGDLSISGSLDRLLGTGMRLLILQVGLAVVVLGLAQGRRLGRPVDEPQPVQIAGSELVAARGELMRQAGTPGDAAAILRADLRREICLRVGLAPTSSVEVIAATVEARTGIERHRVLPVIADQPVERDRDLVVLARSIDSIREEILHVPSA